MAQFVVAGEPLGTSRRTEVSVIRRLLHTQRAREPLRTSEGTLREVEWIMVLIGVREQNYNRSSAKIDNGCYRR